MRVGSVCSGVGALDLAFESAGFTTAWQAEIDPYASEVLAKRWPGVENLGDWTTEELLLSGREIDILIGGIPCQGNSVAGRREGIDDARNLAPAFFRLVDALRPRLFVIENVGGILTASDGDMFASIVEAADALGYSAEWDICSAAYAGAPHRRERVFIVGRNDGRETWPQREQPALFSLMPWSWPKAGRWNGTLHERERQWQTPKRPDWTTPRAGDSKQGPSSTAKHLESGDIMLTDEVRLWPTTSAQDAADSGAAGYSTDSGRHEGVTLTDATRRLPEPRSGRLSPDWAETLMGWPVGWTDLDCDEPEAVPYPRAMACGGGAVVWPTPRSVHTPEHIDTVLARRKRHNERMQEGGDHDGGSVSTEAAVTVPTGEPWSAPNGRPAPLYGASPQGDWEPPRLVEAVKGDQRRNRLRCIGNGVEYGTGRIVAESIMRSLK